MLLRCLGARVDLYSHIDTADVSGFDLVRFGARTTVNRGAAVRAHRFVTDPTLRCAQVHLQPVLLGRGSWVGQRAVVPAGDAEVMMLPPLSSHPAPQPPYDIRHSFNGPLVVGTGTVVLWTIGVVLALVLLAALRVALFCPLFLFSKWLSGHIAASFVSSNWHFFLVVGALLSAGHFPTIVGPLLLIFSELDAKSLSVLLRQTVSLVSNSSCCAFTHSLFVSDTESTCADKRLSFSSCFYRFWSFRLRCCRRCCVCWPSGC